jgi:hypothetical protein
VLGHESSCFIQAGEIVMYMTFVRTVLYAFSVWSLRLDYFRPLLLQSFPIPKVLKKFVCSEKQFKRGICENHAKLLILSSSFSFLGDRRSNL